MSELRKTTLDDLKEFGITLTDQPLVSGWHDGKLNVIVKVDQSGPETFDELVEWTRENS